MTDPSKPTGSKDDPSDDNIQPLLADPGNNPTTGLEVCSFCGKGPDTINALVSKGDVRICDLCINAARAGLDSD